MKPHSRYSSFNEDNGPLSGGTPLVGDLCTNEAKALNLLKPISMLCSILYFLVMPKENFLSSLMNLISWC